MDRRRADREERCRGRELRRTTCPSARPARDDDLALHPGVERAQVGVRARPDETTFVAPALRELRRRELVRGRRVRRRVGVPPRDRLPDRGLERGRLEREAGDRDGRAGRLHGRLEQRCVLPHLEHAAHAHLVVVADEALDLVDAGREIERHPGRLARGELHRLGVVVPAIVTVVVDAPDLELQAVAELAAVRDDERHTARPDRLGLGRERPLAQRDLESAGPRIDAGGPGRNRRDGGPRAGCGVDRVAAAEGGSTREQRQDEMFLGHSSPSEP